MAYGSVRLSALESVALGLRWPWLETVVDQHGFFLISLHPYYLNAFTLYTL